MIDSIYIYDIDELFEQMEANNKCASERSMQLMVWETDFMFLFDLPEVKVKERSPAERYSMLFSKVHYIDSILNMQYTGQLQIPYVRFETMRGSIPSFDYKSEWTYMNIQDYHGGCCMCAKIKTTDLIHYDMTKLSTKICGINWDIYKNKKGVIDDSGKMEFLTDIIKHKAKKIKYKYTY